VILIYAFSNRWGTNIARRTLTELQKIFPFPQINYQPVFFLPKPFFHKFIEHETYDLIIGLGDGSKFLSKIKIETQAKNAYNDQPIYPFSPILLDLNLPPLDIYDGNLFEIGHSMGTYNCNYLAYSTQLYLNQKKHATPQIFLHLPPGFNATLLAQKISELLVDNHIF
jgi:pyrrolidone-carboxylate peptidase